MNICKEKLIPRESAENDIDPADSPLATDKVGDFISDAEWAHMSSALV